MEISAKIEEPETDMEKKLALVWAKVLDVDLNRIGRHTSFFELGGDSINSINLVSLSKDLGLVLNTALIFKKSTLAQMANIRDISSEKVSLKPIHVA